MNLKNRQQVLGLAAILAVALFAGDKVVFTPAINLWKQRTARIAELRSQVEQGQALLQRETAIRRRWEQMSMNTLPKSASLAEQRLLKAFDGWAQESRVSVLSISPQWKRDTEKYMSLECRVEAFGSLSTVSRFLYNIERDPLGLRLESVELTARDNDGQQITLGLLLSGLVLNPPAQ